MTASDSHPRTARPRARRRLAALVIAALAAGGLAAGAPALAAGAVEASQDGDLRIRKLQSLLTELELYRDPVDGKERPSLAAALALFTQKHNLPSEILQSDAVIDQLEAAVKLRRLTRFLFNLGREQAEQAREALLSQPATRDLVAPQGDPAPAAALPPGAVFACVRAPSPACLVAAAVEASDAIEEPRLRDWALGEIAKAQARAGDAEAARASIRRLTDARQIIVGLRDLAATQAERGEPDAALDTAGAIPDPVARAEGALAIAARGAAAGNASPRALALAADAIAQVAEPLQRIALRARLATLRWRGGDRDAARAEIAALDTEARTLPSRDSRGTAADFIATALAETDRPADAVRLLEELRAGGRAPGALAAAATALARAGDFAEAERVAGQIEEARYRAPALVQVALAAARGGAPDKARALLAATDAVTREIDEAAWRDYPLSRLAQAHVELGQPAPAAVAARAIADPNMRARLLYLIAHLEARDGAPDAAATAAEADRTAGGIVAPLDHCWMLGEVAAVFLAAGDRAAAREMLRRGTEIAAAIQDPASRARAFSRLATVMQAL